MRRAGFGFRGNTTTTKDRHMGTKKARDLNDPEMVRRAIVGLGSDLTELTKRFDNIEKEIYGRMGLISRLMDKVDGLDAQVKASEMGCCVNGCGCGVPRHADLKQQMEAKFEHPPWPVGTVPLPSGPFFSGQNEIDRLKTNAEYWRRRYMNLAGENEND